MRESTYIYVDVKKLVVVVVDRVSMRVQKLIAAAHVECDQFESGVWMKVSNDQDVREAEEQQTVWVLGRHFQIAAHLLISKLILSRHALYQLIIVMCI